MAKAKTLQERYHPSYDEGPPNLLRARSAVLPDDMYCKLQGFGEPCAERPPYPEVYIRGGPRAHACLEAGELLCRRRIQLGQAVEVNTSATILRNESRLGFMKHSDVAQHQRTTTGVTVLQYFEALFVQCLDQPVPVCLRVCLHLGKARERRARCLLSAPHHEE